MNIEDIKKLVEMMVSNDLSELDIIQGEDKVSLKRGRPAPAPMAMTAIPAAMPAPMPTAAPAPAAAPVAPKADSNLIEIRSPMVGTFYSAPSPDSEPYVKVGTSVTDSTVACIIEAMKVMNEIKAECAGVVTEVCVRNAQPVEFGQVLFKVRPA